MEREGFHEKKCGKWGRIWARAAISERATAKRPIYQTFMAKTISHLIVVLTPKRSGCPDGTGHAVAFEPQLCSLIEVVTELDTFEAMSFGKLSSLDPAEYTTLRRFTM